MELLKSRNKKTIFHSASGLVEKGECVVANRIRTRFQVARGSVEESGMTMQKGSGNKRERERRRDSRITLMALDLQTIAADNGVHLFCTVHNINRFGVMLEIVTAKPADVMRTGQRFRFVECDSSLSSLLLHVGGQILWINGNIVGLSFDKPLPVTLEWLREHLDNLRLLPWEMAG